MSRRLDHEAIGRVVRAATTAGLAITPEKAAETLTRDWRISLEQAVSWACTLHSIGPDLESSSRSRRRYEALGEAARVATRLILLIGDSDLPLNQSLDRHLDLASGASTQSAVASLRLIVAAATSERTRLEESGLDKAAVFDEETPRGPKLGTSPGFISEIAKAYRDHFHQEPTILFDTSRSPGGPFVAFVQATIEELVLLGEPAPMSQSAAAIAKAFERI